MSNQYSQPFPVTLAAVRKGALVNELTEQLAVIVAGVMEFGKPGKLTLTLSIRPATKRSSEMVVIEDDLTVKVPQADRPGSLFFATDDGGLSRTDPNQTDLPFTAVATEEGR